MAFEVVVFTFGAILMSAGCFGGGISIKDISIPKLGLMPRVASTSLGTIFILTGLAMGIFKSPGIASNPSFSEASSSKQTEQPIEQPPKVDPLPDPQTVDNSSWDSLSEEPLPSTINRLSDTQSDHMYIEELPFINPDDGHEFGEYISSEDLVNEDEVPDETVETSSSSGENSSAIVQSPNVVFSNDVISSEDNNNKEPEDNDDQLYREQINTQLQYVGEQLEVDGYEMTHEALSGELSDNTFESLTIELYAGWSYSIIGVCDEDCGDLDLKLYDEYGNEVDTDLADDDIPMVTVIPDWDTAFTLNVGMPSCGAPYCYYGVGIFGQ